MEIAKPKRKPRKRNPSPSMMAMVKKIIPVLVGGGVGALDEFNPGWWSALSYTAKAMILGAAGLFLDSKQAGKAQNHDLAIAAQTMASYYAGKAAAKKAMQLYIKHQMSQGLPPGVDCQGEECGALFDRSPQMAQIIDDANAEMRAVAQRYDINDADDQTLGAFFSGYGQPDRA